MTSLTRTIRVDAGGTPGEFDMILATEGEASDGHILSIRGGDVPEHLPLLNSHFNSPTETLGSITAPRKDLDSTPAMLRATGKIEMDGAGAQAEIRRDLAHMIERGHVGAVSIRWDGLKSTARVDLPNDHPFRVEKGATGPERHGLFFEQWRALEGSVVAIGADSGALIQHADSCEDPNQREFWRSMAVAASGDTTIVEDTSHCVSSIDEECGVLHEPCVEAMSELERIELLEHKAIMLRGYVMELRDMHADLERQLSAAEDDGCGNDCSRDHCACKRSGQIAREPDPVPTEAAITIKSLGELLRMSRELQAQDTARMIEERISRAIGRVRK